MNETLRPLDDDELDLYREGLRTAPSMVHPTGHYRDLVTITTAEWADRCRRLLVTLDAARSAVEVLATLNPALASEAAPASGEGRPTYKHPDPSTFTGNRRGGPRFTAAVHERLDRAYCFIRDCSLPQHRPLASTATPPEPGLDAAWAAAEAAAQTWAGGRMEGVEYLPLRDESERWSARLWTNLGGWIGFGPTADAALRDVAWKCSGQGTRQPFDDATERAALSAVQVPIGPPNDCSFDGSASPIPEAD